MSISSRHIMFFSRDRLTACLSSVFAILMTVGSSLHAAGMKLEEIIVTAQKREQSVYDVPISVVAITGEELDTRGIDNFADLAAAVPDLSVWDTGPYSRTITIRGVGNVYGASSLIGMYLDEVPVAGVPSAQLDLRTVDLERVEVLRGPQGTLYGEGSSGGTIRFITKDPQLDRLRTKGDVSASFTEEGDPGQEVSGIVDIPLIEDELGLRIAGTFVNSGGWIDQPAVSRSDINDQEVVNTRIKGLWRPSEALELKAMAVIHRNDAGAGSRGEDENGDYAQAFGRSTIPSVDDDYEIYNVTFSYNFNSVRLLNSSSYISADKQAHEAGSSVQILPPPGLPFHVLTSFTQPSEIFTNEVRLSSLGDGGLTWIIGGLYREFKTGLDGSTELGFPAAPFAFISFDNETTSESWAVFGDASYALVDRLVIGVGLRYFEDDQEQDDFLVNTTQSASFDALNPRVYLNYDITDKIKIYASTAKGFRSGGFNAVGQPSYEPEVVWTHELGSKMSLLDGRLNAEAAIFYSDYEDMQAFGVPLPPNVAAGRIFNLGEAEIKGIDWELSYQATEDLVLGFSGNYIDTEVVTINAITTSHAIGDPVDMIPEYNYTLWANHDFDWGSVPGFVRVDYSEQGKSTSRDRSIGDHYILKSDVISMLNVNVGWEWSRWSFGIFARNLLDERGLVAPFASNAPRPRPRTIGLNIGFNFD